MEKFHFNNSTLYEEKYHTWFLKYMKILEKYQESKKGDKNNIWLSSNVQEERKIDFLYRYLFHLKCVFVTLSGFNIL